jgi:hypothetical protein
MARYSSGKVILPLVERHNHLLYPHWRKQIPCPVCGKPCWIPGGAEEAMRKGGQAVCEECNVTCRPRSRGTG